MNPTLHVSDEVKETLHSNGAVVALESTLITHGLPYPANFKATLARPCTQTISPVR